jgi:predicted TIM-barrel fold metal-dependent hydrolase
VPYILSNLSRWLNNPGENPDSNISFQLPKDLLAELNLFVTCLVDEDLEHIVQYAGEDNLIIGSDYTHADRSHQHNFIEQLGARAAQGDISSRAVEKILSDNPRRLYGL